MHKVIWLKKKNLIKLVNSADSDEEIVPPRVVYTNELRILGVNKYSYPNENVPVCWCCDRKYFYKGELIFEAKGGNIYNAPNIAYPKVFPCTSLQQINLQELEYENQKSLSVLENEAMDFINDQFVQRENKVDAFAVAFSGGKDSQVVLDLVTRVIPPNKFKVFYTDTGMELPCTYDLVEKTNKVYSKLFPDFKLTTCSSEDSIVEQWNKYGPPSRMNRWCCKVRKTALFTRKLKDELNHDGQPRCVVFEGVRSDESARRSAYERVGVGVKHINLINCRPIFDWNDAEVYMYLLCRAKVDINEGYKMGLNRIGCNICPFASDWSEYLINKIYPEISKPFIEVIERMARAIGITDQNRINDYISSGNWKKNAGGKGLDIDNTRMDIIKKEPTFECVIHYPKEDWKIWINTVGKHVISNQGNGKYVGSIQYEDTILKYSAEELPDKLMFNMSGTSGNVRFTGFLNKVLTKTAYCERCGVCEAECPTGALVIRKNKFMLDKDKCINCHNCYDVNSYGCIVSGRRRVSEGGTATMSSKKTRSSGIDKYSTFGIREEWFAGLMNMGDEWFIDYPGLGPKMVPAAINWFRDARIVDLKEKKLSTIGLLVQQLYEKKPFFAWQIVWINLCFNSLAVQCYVQDLIPLIRYKKADIITTMQYRYPELSEATLGNPTLAILNMFENTPFGCKAEDEDFSNYSLRMGSIEKIEKERFTKIVGTDNVSNISIAYLLYLIAEKENRYVFTVSELVEDKAMNGPSTVFNMTEEKFKAVLRGLTESGYLSAELVAGLDNIKLNPDIKSEELLRRMVDKL